jgi:hypothetical protein
MVSEFNHIRGQPANVPEELIAYLVCDENTHASGVKSDLCEKKLSIESEFFFSQNRGE